MPTATEETRARTGLTADERRARASLAAQAMHSMHDATLTTAKARAAYRQRFLDIVDPDHTLHDAERERRATAAMKAQLARMTLQRMKARRLRRAAARRAAREGTRA